MRTLVSLFDQVHTITTITYSRIRMFERMFERTDICNHNTVHLLSYQS